MTLVGNLQSALFLPLTWILLVLPLGYAWGVLAVAKLALAGLGAYVVARQVRAGWAGGMVSGVVMMLRGPDDRMAPMAGGHGDRAVPVARRGHELVVRSPGPLLSVAGIATASGLVGDLTGHPKSALVEGSGGCGRPPRAPGRRPPRAAPGPDPRGADLGRGPRPGARRRRGRAAPVLGSLPAERHPRRGLHVRARPARPGAVRPRLPPARTVRGRRACRVRLVVLHHRGGVVRAARPPARPRLGRAGLADAGGLGAAGPRRGVLHGRVRDRPGEVDRGERAALVERSPTGACLPWCCRRGRGRGGFSAFRGGRSHRGPPSAR